MTDPTFDNAALSPDAVRTGSEAARNSLNLLEQAFKANRERLRDFKGELDDVARLFRGSFSSALQQAMRDGGGFTSMFEKMRGALEELALRLAIVNPISNILFGGNQATTGQLGGIVSATPQGGLLQALTGSFAELIGARAFGGPVGMGQPYVVGERGPELFVPQAAGRIVPQVPTAPVHITMHVNTPDAASFRASQTQIAAQMLDAARRAQRIR